MKIIRSYVSQTMDFEKFADQHGLELWIGVDANDRFYCHFEGTKIKEGSLLVSTSGRGISEAAAICAYAESISRKRLVIDACTYRRREIDVPVLAYNP